MTKDKQELVSKIIEKNELFISAERLKSYGLNTYDIGLLLSDGRLERVKRGLYKWTHLQQEYNEMVEVAGIVPEGVLCLFSALSFHELTTYIPKEYNVAILRTMRKPVLPSYPPIRIVYLSKQRFDTGIIEVKIQGYKIKIYDLEKTVCDAVIYRNKIGVDIVKEVMERYILKPQKNLQRLTEYAEKLRIFKMIKTYLEVLI
ncbi:MAG: Abortive infection protein AbiEi [Clostridia bacterium]